MNAYPASARFLDAVATPFGEEVHPRLARGRRR